MATTMEEHALAAGRAFPWHEVYAPNAQAAVDFYTQALGMDTEDFDMGPGGKYRMLKVGGTSVAGIMSTSENPDMKDVPPHWAVYHAVDDVDARIQKVTELGGKVVVPAFDVPQIGRMALICDPQGAHLWLFKDANS